jgi:hypothetical protein
MEEYNDKRKSPLGEDRNGMRKGPKFSFYWIA